jgi:8-oxo-dGTP pyrophosphatase MutT (NUDIX family)
MRTIHRDIVAGLVVSKDNKFLFGMKDPRGGGVYADCWHTPGGGIEDGETQEQALKREMAEELGIDTDDAEVSLLDSEGRGESQKTLKQTGETVLCRMKFYVYRIYINKKAADIIVTPGDDIEGYMWADAEKLSAYKLTPPSIKLFNRLGWLK